MGIRAFPMGLPKAKINSNIANKPKKWLPMDELHMRQNGNLLQCQAIYALHCSLGISFFFIILFSETSLLPSSSFLSSVLLAVAVKTPISEETLSSSHQ